MSISIKQIGRKFQINDGGRYLNFLSLQEAQNYIAGKGVPETKATTLLEDIDPVFEAELAEALGKDADAGKWIEDFIASENPKFAGKSKAKRRQMALAAYYAKQNEEVNEAAKPDFLDLDKDGNKEESMKKAAKDKKEKEAAKREKEHEYNNRVNTSSMHEDEKESEKEGHEDEKEDKALIKKMVKKDCIKEGESDIDTLKKHLEHAGYDHSEGTIHHAIKAGNKIHFAAHDPESGHFTATFHVRGKGGEFGVHAGEESEHKSKEEAIEHVKKQAALKESEQLDEVSKKTLGSYIKKAAQSGVTAGAGIEKANQINAKVKQYTNTNDLPQDVKNDIEDKVMAHAGKEYDTHMKKAKNRMRGISKATERLTKEDTDTFKSYEYEIVESYESLLQATLSLAGYANLAEASDEEKGLIIKALEEAYDAKNFDIVLEDYVRQDVEDSIEAHKKAGHKVSDPKYTKKDGKMYAQYTLTTPEGDKKTITYHGSKKRMENIAE